MNLMAKYLYKVFNCIIYITALSVLVFFDTNISIVKVLAKAAYELKSNLFLSYCKLKCFLCHRTEKRIFRLIVYLLKRDLFKMMKS